MPAALTRNESNSLVFSFLGETLGKAGEAILDFAIATSTSIFAQCFRSY